MAPPLFVLVIIPLLLNFGPIPSTASAPVRRHHHHSPASTTAHFHSVPSATPSTHQNHLEAEESKSLLAVDPFAAEVDQATSGEEAMAMAVMGATAHPAVLVLPQASQSPPELTAAQDLASQAPPQQPQEEADGSASATTAPRLNDPASSTTTLLPLLNQHTSVEAASPRPPSQAGTAGVVASEGEQGLQQLGRVLTSLGYNDMASAAPLLANSTPLARWPGAITVFAAPDVFLQISCPMCSRRHLLLEHIAMGYYPYSELVATPTAKIPSASIGFCLKVASERGPFGIHYARIYVDRVEVSHPELYNDGRYVVHGLHGFLRPLSRSSCFDSSHHHLTALSASVMRVMIWETIARLRDRGYGFMALIMRAKFAELERFANLTVFALDDQGIFVDGGHDYVSVVRFHIVPGHHLTRADLLNLHAGIILPTLAGEGQSLVVTHVARSSSDDVRINYIPIKEPDVVVNSRIVVHGVYVPFPLSTLTAAADLDAQARPLLQEEADGSVSATFPSQRSSVVAASPPPPLQAQPRQPRILPRLSMKIGQASGVGGPGNAASGGSGGMKMPIAVGIGVAGILAVGVLLNKIEKEENEKNEEKQRSFARFRRMLPPLAADVNPHLCSTCGMRGNKWRLDCCGFHYCEECLVEAYLEGHSRSCCTTMLCAGEGTLINVGAKMDSVHPEYAFSGKKTSIGYNLHDKWFINIGDLMARRVPRQLVVRVYGDREVRVDEWFEAPGPKALPMG